MSFPISDFPLGRQRNRQWASLITQQLRLRHIYQIYAFNLLSEKKTNYYFTLHNTLMSSPIYTSEKITSQNPKWNELLFKDENTNVSSVVIRIWKSCKDEDEVVVTWGVNFSGMVYLGNKMADLQPKYFKTNTVIFFMQGGYFTSQDYIKTDLQKALPFHKYLNLIEIKNNEFVLYRKVAIKTPKGEVQNTYTLEKLQRLQDLQRLIEKKKIDVQDIKEKIRNATATEQKADTSDSPSSAYGNNIRFAPQLLTMNSLNKMLHEKPTKFERQQMTKLSKEIEEGKFRVRLLSQEKDKKNVLLRKLKQTKNKLCDENQERESKLMSLYHMISKDKERLNEYNQNICHHQELFIHTSRQLHLRQKQLLKELLFIYPIEKISNENKYTMLGIHLPDSEILTDCSDPGVSVVLGYICHILIMCSIFLQVPLRYPMKHFGSRSVIYNQVSAAFSEKDREFPLYTKGKDKAHFGYAVFLLNENLSQLRWYFYHLYTLDLKETLKHLLNFLQGSETSGIKFNTPTYDITSKRCYMEASPKLPDVKLASCSSSSTVAGDRLDKLNDSAMSSDKLVSLSLSSTSSNINDPLLDRILGEIRQERIRMESRPNKSPSKKLSFFRSLKQCKKESCSKGSSEVLALPEAFLNKQISKDLFDRYASGKYNFLEKCVTSSGTLENQYNFIKIKDGIEEFQANIDTNSTDLDVIEQGTDPLDPSTSLDAIITRSIRIHSDQCLNHHSDLLPENKRISRSVESCVDNKINNHLKVSFDLGSDPLINVSCDNTNNKEKAEMCSGVPVGEHRLFEEWLSDESRLVLPSELMFPEESLRMSLQDISYPLMARTDRLLSMNQSFNLVKHRTTD